MTVPRRAKDDAILGILTLFDPLGFQERGSDLIAFYRESSAARAAGGALDASRVRHEISTDLPEEDPLEAYRAASRPFSVGKKFWIDPGPPSPAAPPAGRVALRLPASRAFGTGGHESTRLALVALEEERLGGVDVLDVGTGSAILALAAVALGARRAFGFDSDPEAIFVARDNLRLHPFGAQVSLAACTPAAISGTFRVVVANLLPEELLPMKGMIFARVGPGGHLLVSGIPSDREQKIISTLKPRRWSLGGCRRENGWTCVTLERG
ncbi:MAG: 50S ribosomal protein L11 methyltransferase [Acidobacteriota bacterium]